MTTTVKTQSSDVSMRMLSPPLSPRPDLPGLMNVYKASSSRSTIVRADPAAPSLKRASPSQSESEGETKRSTKKMVTCWDSLLSDPVKYFKRERGYLDLYPMHKPSWSGYSFSDSGSESRIRRKPRASPRRQFGELDMSSDSAVTRSRAASVTPSERAGSERSTDDERSSSKPHSPSKKRTTNGSGVRVHDLNIAQIEDYSPDTSLLPPGRSLRAEWKGAPMDLSTDPDVHLLHPAEVHLASVLRLPAEVYLDSKRRLFAEKVHRLRQGLAFRRTDSQKACRIDVNKASRLFGAFEKVGWLEDDLFAKYL